VLIVDLRRVDPVRPDPPGEYALQLVGALVRIAVHAEITVLEPGYEGPLPAAGTLFQPAGGRPSPRHRCIVAVHDLAHLRSGLLGFGRRFATAFSTSRSDVVIAPSEVVAEALALYLRVPAGRLAIVQPGLEPRFARTSATEAATLRAELGLPERYLLAFGDAALARRAWSGATTPAEGAGLVLAEELRVERMRLPALLSGAVGVLLCESLNGCPIRALEAMACGSPPRRARRRCLSRGRPRWGPHRQSREPRRLVGGDLRAVSQPAPPDAALRPRPRARRAAHG